MQTATRHQIRIDRSKTLAEDSATDHNHWHPDIPPDIWCDQWSPRVRPHGRRRTPVRTGRTTRRDQEHGGGAQESTSKARGMRTIEDQTVRVELRAGRRFEECELVSSGVTGVETLWMLVDGEDVLVSKRQLVTVAGAGVRGRPLR